MTLPMEYVNIYSMYVRESSLILYSSHFGVYTTCPLNIVNNARMYLNRRIHNIQILESKINVSL